MRRSWATCTGIQFLDSHAIAHFQSQFRCSSSPEFNNLVNSGSRSVAGTGVAGTGWNISRDRCYHPIPQKDHIQRDEGILHPEVDWLRRIERKQHPSIGWQRLPVHQPHRLLGRCPSHFQQNLPTCYDRFSGNWHSLPQTRLCWCRHWGRIQLFAWLALVLLYTRLGCRRMHWPRTAQQQNSHYYQ